MLKCVAHTQTQTHTCAKIKRNPVEQIVLRHLQNYAMQSTSTACSPLLSCTPLHSPRRSYTPHHFALSPSAHCAAHVTFASQQQQQQQIHFNSHLNIFQSQRFFTRRSRRQQRQHRQLTNKNKLNTTTITTTCKAYEMQQLNVSDHATTFYLCTKQICCCCSSSKKTEIIL